MLREASLSRRLLAGAGIFIALALVVAAVVIFFVLHRFVQGQIDQRLDTQIVFLQSLLRADGDGLLMLAGDADGPPFDRSRRGWYWQIMGPKNTLRSRSLDGGDLEIFVLPSRPRPLPPLRDRDEVRRSSGERPEPADGPGPHNAMLHFRIKTIMVSGTSTKIVAAAPRAAVQGPLREAMTTLAVSLGVLGIALVLSMVFQVRVGLRPLEQLRRALADVRAGRRDRVPSEQPREVQPLVSELNGLLEQNTANLERARRHVANLAHGLKTPLATLAVALPRGSTRSELHELVDLMERRIRHHLGRARAAALSGPVRSQTVIFARLADLGAVLGRVYADKRVEFGIDVAPDIAVSCEQQDFDEMAGNVLDNAFKWAKSKVVIRARVDGDRKIVLFVDDDGPGVRPDQIPQMMRPGQRLDESAPGFGFGLSITQELAELYGGALDLSPSSSGGLRVSLTLPLATAI